VPQGFASAATLALSPSPRFWASFGKAFRLTAAAAPADNQIMPGSPRAKRRPIRGARMMSPFADPDDWEEDPLLYDDPDDVDDDYPDEATEETTDVCPNCGAEIYDDTERCPVCEQYITQSTSQPGWVIAGVVLCLLAALGWVLFR
jgi:hypothetical protein